MDDIAHCTTQLASERKSVPLLQYPFYLSGEKQQKKKTTTHYTACILLLHVEISSAAPALMSLCTALHGPVAQWIRHRPTEPGIAGSSPAGVIAVQRWYFSHPKREPYHQTKQPTALDRRLSRAAARGGTMMRPRPRLKQHTICALAGHQRCPKRDSNPQSPLGGPHALGHAGVATDCFAIACSASQSVVGLFR